MKDKAEDTKISSDEGLSTAMTPIAVAVAVTIPSAPPFDEANTDEEAHALAAAAREEGITNIRNHCTQHLSQNPGSSYVTWIATLHPENAEVVIDPRFLIDGNPWLTVYEEATDDLQKGRGYYNDASADDTIEVTPVTPSASPLTIHNGQGGGGDVPVSETDGSKKCGGGGFLDFVIGNVLALLSISATFAFELAAAYCYLWYCLCLKVVNKCSPPTMCTCLPWAIAFILSKLFQLLDTLLLLESIILVECIAGANYVLCTIFSCSHRRGRDMHQMTRKLPHLVRWAFRQKFKEWNPPRTNFGLSMANSE